MAKSERRRTIVYSNVNKKADKNSASNNDIINLDNEIVIGLTRLPNPKEVAKNKKKEKNKSNKHNKENDKVDYNFGLDIDEDMNGKKSKIKKNNKVNKSNTNKVNNKKVQAQSQTKTPERKQSKTQEQTQGKVRSKAQANQQLITLQQRIKMQKRRVIRKMAIFFLLLILLIGGLVYFLLSPAFSVKAIQVSNNITVSTEQIINSSGITMNENMFKFSKKEVKNKILSNPYVEDIKVSRKLFSNKVQIDVKERMATLMLEYGNSYVYINNQGYILEISAIKLDTPILKGYVTPLEEVKPGNRLNKDDLERLKTVLDIIESANSNGLAELITQMDIKSKKDYKIVLETEDKVVHLGDCSDLSTKMLYIKEMIEREKGIEGDFFVDMDLNTGNPVFREKV